MIGVPAVPTAVAVDDDQLPRRSRHRLCLVIDPRFSGGTSMAVAAEIRTLAGCYDLSVVALETRMFRGRSVHPAIEAALEETGLFLQWDPPVARADTIVFHNPSCLRYDHAIAMRMSCARLFVVTHENFLRPGGSEGFDVAVCLGMIAAATIGGRRLLAPVSRYNRGTVTAWLAGRERDWEVADSDWFSILDLPRLPPTNRPRDRRGRHSRPGLEKFPPLATMLAHFPNHTECNVILGGDVLLLEAGSIPPHWDVRKFEASAVSKFLSEIDFFVYFTNPRWRESFGRAVAEAIAAGKLVITDRGTAESFGSAVIASDGDDVDGIVASFVEDPTAYAAFVRAAQETLERHRPEAFVRQVAAQIARTEAAGHVLV
jgi:hypothetical protein